MGKVRPGNKKNSGLNGEWAKHVRKDGKKSTAGLRRTENKKTIRKDLKEKEEDDRFYDSECFMCGKHSDEDVCPECSLQV